MSETIYRLLLRLYPSRFRSRFGDEAIQLFRDRLRDERGVLRRTRLWLDVLRDLARSAPREHTRPPARPARASSDGPSFLVLEEEPLRPDMFVLGTVLAVLAVGTFGYLLTHGGNRAVLPAIANPLYQARGLPTTSGTGQQHAAAQAGGQATPVPVVSPAERELVLRRVIDAVQKDDPDPAEARSVAALLEDHENQGDYNGILQGPVFAAVLTREIDGVTRQMSVTVLCGQQALPGSAIWIAPSHPGRRAWLRIDDRFSVVVEPLKPGPESGGQATP